MEYSLAGAITAFIALGANFAGVGLLLMLNPRSRPIQWYAVFTCVVIAWLAGQGLTQLGPVSPGVLRAYSIVLYMLPVTFLAVTLTFSGAIRDRSACMLLALGLLVVLFVIPREIDWKYVTWWHVGGWGSAALLRMFGRRGTRAQPMLAGRRALDISLNLLLPFGVIGAIFLPHDFTFILLPLISTAAVFLVFVGVVYHHYYDIEIRAARTGEIGMRAAEHERLALLGEVASTVAHEVRNPLTGMRSLAQQLRDNPPDDATRNRYLGVILDQITRLDGIVSNLLDVAKRPSVSGDVVSVELATLFADLELLVESRAKRVLVSLRSDAHGLVMTAPREPLEQALLNLLLNAIAHAPPESVVELSAERQDAAVVIRVCDRGPGIPASERERIFEAFHTGSGGTGLGLAVVRTLARDNGWTVEVHDAPSGGAEMRLILPRGEAAQ